ncbi:MAG: hypothetical protein J1G02_03365 [Clostridiales bacterium]|nr:hypothetical protein [Clostridiales bacterium]
MLNSLNAVSYFNLIANRSYIGLAVGLSVGFVLMALIVTSLILYFIFPDKLRNLFHNKFWTAIGNFFRKLKYVFQNKVGPAFKKAFSDKSNNESDNIVVEAEQNATNGVQIDPVSNERMLIGMTLDTRNLQRIYVAGNQFDCSGLVVRAQYNINPVTVCFTEYSIVDKETYVRLRRRGNAKGVYVIAPYMDIEGERVVAVKFEDYSEEYKIYVKERHPSAEYVETANAEATDSSLTNIDEYPSYDSANTSNDVVYIDTYVSFSDRRLKRIFLDARNVPREFNTGDDFDYSGLVVQAKYNAEPTQVTLTDYNLVDQETYYQLRRRNKTPGVYIIKPDMNVAGEATVNVEYEGKSAQYTIFIKSDYVEDEYLSEAVAQDVVAPEQDTGDFIVEQVNVADLQPTTEQFVETTDTQVVATEAVDDSVETAVNTDVEVLPEQDRNLTGIVLDTTAVQRTFTAGETFDCSGLVVHAQYSDEPTSVILSDYDLIDIDTYARLRRRGKVSGVYVIKPSLSEAGDKIVMVMFEDKSASYSISIEQAPISVQATEPTVEAVKSDESDVQEYVEVSRQIQSITINTDAVLKQFVEGNSFTYEGLVVTAHFNVEPYDEIVADYSVSLPNMHNVGTQTVVVTYLDHTAEYQITVDAAPKVKKNPSPAVIIEEETVDTRLRYDKSFMARLIQSDDEVKYWYTDLKNEILSYKGVKSRISWKRETFKCGGKLVLAKLSYRGKVLCIYLPLNPADFPKYYPVEDASDLSCYLDTPLMVRLKNPKRMEIAKDLIGMVMKKNKMVRVPHESIDYYVPYEGILDLINKGYARRNIRTAEEEAIFERDNMNIDLDEDTLTLTEVAPRVYVTKK